ncbi:MAG: DUF502 domain-containing protein [Flavobacteriales bacterium]|nr:DUF502 domain-containing protein [Flavobacteriales bacterium]MCB9335678.1 DUF502 domain-containing protein [Flavobacteriales bacterium]
MKRLLGYFLQGLLYTLPIAATIYVVVEAIILIDGIIPVKFPGLGLLILILAITLVGFLGSTIIVQQFFSLEKILDRIPLIKIIYTSVKDLLSAFVGKKKRFTKPVLVKMEGGVERLGFVTQEDLTDIGIPTTKIGVYIPFSYAVTGNLIIVPRENVTPIDANSADIMKFVISGGVTELEDHDEEED